ncbi:MAG TPA: hydroxyethylthiazole kinase [Gammaproteobacteria bacterium]|jgi:hydroxyethylthiazole kinase|nr:hydroxyethylthiazole kinase [Gammaproteobacteria bacterium]
MLTKLRTALTSVKTTRPLVLNLTNIVTMDFMANAQLAIGASPLMSVSNDELEELIAVSNAVNINLGTLDAPFIERCLKAASLAKQYGKPMVLDPVGAGASRLRTTAALSLLPYCTILRGNASEILALQNIAHQTKGVDAVHTTDDSKQAANELAKKFNIVTVVSGATDYITDNELNISFNYGSPLMPRVVGMGCTLTAVIAAFAGSVANPYEAAITATLYFSLCGSIAAKNNHAPASFQLAFVDTLYNADETTLSHCYAE